MDAGGFRPGTERSITLHTCDRLRQWPHALKGHAALQLPTAVPVALGQADTMVTTGLLTVRSGCEGRRDTQGSRGERARVHHHSTALRLLLEGKRTVPLALWHESSHPVEEEAKATEGLRLQGAFFPGSV